MARLLSRKDRSKRVHRRSRHKVLGSPERPRLCVFRSLKHTYAQLVDDSAGRTLASASTLNLGGVRFPNGGNVAAAREVGKAIAQKALAMGVEQVVFDRNGHLYHGRVKAVAEAAREAGLKF
ncbi:MAG TPA: 50S ribosomal protein L18 [Acidobacteriota bacterium]|nr:50S ribosomal protein L18 [Acidobacteriota bacterium]